LVFSPTFVTTASTPLKASKVALLADVIAEQPGATAALVEELPPTVPTESGKESAEFLGVIGVVEHRRFLKEPREGLLRRRSLSGYIVGASLK
jgi:hypothetical protein